MVATVGSISIDLSTNAAKFASGFRSAASTVDKESARMSKAVTGFSAASKAASGILSGFVGGIVAGGALAALGSLTGALGKARQALSDFEEIGNRARTVGLKTDFFQALSFGALQADVDQEKLNKSLEIFAKNVGLAQEGTGALFSGLKNLNPELLKAVLTTTDQGERLKLVADAFKQTTDATDRAALANVVFGKSGIDLVRVFDGGAAALDEFQRKAKDLGLIVPDELIQKAGELDDKLEILAKVIDLNLSQALSNAAPLLVAMASGTADFAKSINDLAGAFSDFAENPGVKNFYELLNYIQNWVPTALNPGKAVADALTEEFSGAALTLRQEIASIEAEIARLQESGEGGAGIVIQQDMERLEQLRAELAKVNSGLVDIQENAKRATLAQLFRASENASMAALKNLSNADGGTGPNPTVHRFGGSNTSLDGFFDDNVHGHIQSDGTRAEGAPRTVNGVRVHSFGGADDARDFIKSIEDNKDATEDGFDESTEATDRTTESVSSLNKSLGGYFDGLGSGVSDLTKSVETGTNEIRQLREKGFYFNYSSLEAAIRTSIVTGLDDSLLGKQFKVSSGNSSLKVLLGSLDNRELESEALQTQLERLKIQADAAGSLAADAFAVKIAQLELKIFDTQQIEADAARKTSILDLGKMNYAGAFADGGSFTAGGNQTGDTTRLLMDVNGGEKVTVTPRGASDRPIVFNYHAAPGESERTARQNARAMLAEMERETARL